MVEPDIAKATPISRWTRLISYSGSLLHVFLTAFFGYLISFRYSIDPLVFVFVLASKLFSMIFEGDGNTSKKKRILSAMASASFITLLIGLSSFEIILGVLILVLYSVYPFCEGRAPFDVIHHALRYILIFSLGFGPQVFSNETALLSLSAIALFSFAGELLGELGKGGDYNKSAASLLGIKRSLITIISLIFIASLITSFVLNVMFEFPILINGVAFPFYIVPALALDLFLTKHLIEALNKKHVNVFHLMRKKEIVAVFVVLLLLVVVVQAGRVGTRVAVDSTSYSFDVGIRTIIAGPHNWDVPWIVFNYVNEDNYYFIVFHTDGTLELSEKISGQYQLSVSSLKTGLTPFQWNNFHVVLNETTVEIELDGEYQLTTSRRLTAETSSIIISPTMPKHNGRWVACVYHISTNAEIQ